MEFTYTFYEKDAKIGQATLVAANETDSLNYASMVAIALNADNYSLEKFHGLPRHAYVIAIQGSHGAELTSGSCMFYDYQKAEKVLKEQYHDKGMKYMKVFSLTAQDDCYAS